MAGADGQLKLSREWWGWRSGAPATSKLTVHRSQQHWKWLTPRIVMSVSFSDMVAYFTPLPAPPVLCSPHPPGALSNIADSVWPRSANVFFLNPSGLLNSSAWRNICPVVEIRLLSHKSEGLGKIAYFTSGKGD